MTVPFQCFFAGCIPIYRGAPDVERYLPKDTFIDARQFSRFEELEWFLRGTTEADARGYLDAARAFLSSATYATFGARRFAGELASALSQVAGL